MNALPELADYPKTIVLADGLHLRLRPMTPDDAPAVRALLARLSAPPFPDQGADPRDAADVLRVLALDEARVVAAATLARRPGAPERYVADLALVLDPDYRGRRLGTWMLLDGVHLAASLGVERLVAEVPADDEPFLAALRRFDFVPEAVPPGGPPGAGRGAPAAVVMVKPLHRAWTDF